MGGLLGDGDVSGSDDLHAIVARAGRRMRWRAAALAGVVAVAAGGGVGYAVSTTGGSARQVVATSPASGSSTRASSQAPSGAQIAGGPSAALPEPNRFTRLFTRQANGIDIRGYLVATPLMMPLSSAGSTECGTAGSHFQAEVSTPDMVATAGSGFVVQQLGSMILSEQTTVVGDAEGDPVAVVVLQTNSAVSKVRMDFTGGATDEMTPVQGWAVLAAPAAWFQSGKVTQETVGTLTALDSSGHSLATTPVQWPPVVTPTQGSVGSGSVGSGSVGSGSAGSGTVGSGSASAGVSGSAAVACPTPAPAPAPARAPSPTITSTGSGTTGSGTTGSGTTGSGTKGSGG